LLAEIEVMGSNPAVGKKSFARGKLTGKDVQKITVVNLRRGLFYM
jgi:hypothetical protein